MNKLNYVNLGKNMLDLSIASMRVYNNCVYGRSHAGMLECEPPHVYAERIKNIDNRINRYLYKFNAMGKRPQPYTHALLSCSLTLARAREELKKYEKYYNKHKI